MQSAERGLREVLDYPDSKLDRTDLYQVAGDLVLRIRQIRPHVVLTFGPDGGLTAHVDHAMAAHSRPWRSSGQAAPIAMLNNWSRD